MPKALEKVVDGFDMDLRLNHLVKVLESVAETLEKVVGLTWLYAQDRLDGGTPFSVPRRFCLLFSN